MLTGVLIIICLFVPVAYFDRYSNFSIWLCGLIYDRGLDNTIKLIDNIIILLIGILLTIIIAISSLMLIRTGNYYRRDQIDDTKIGKLCVSYGIVIIAGIIVFLVLLNQYTYHNLYPNGIWNNLNPGIGLVGPCGGGIMEVGLGIAFLKTSRAKKKEQLKSRN